MVERSIEEASMFDLPDSHICCIGNDEYDEVIKALGEHLLERASFEGKRKSIRLCSVHKFTHGNANNMSMY